jgi:glycolate oxidase
MPDRNITTELRKHLPGNCILTHPEELRPYECDALSAYQQLPLVVVIPETLEQVQTTLRLCAEHKVPVVARGAGTGLSGGALPLENGVLLSLAKFNRILDIDIQNRVARVQPGVTNLSISKAVEQYRPLLTNCLLHRGQRRRKCRRCTLPEVRPDYTQYPGDRSADH